MLALFAVTSSPLILGNDPREGRMQQRLIELLTNPVMIEVDQEYSTAAGFAGGRIASKPQAQELWAKPLPNLTVAVVLFNRGGTVIGTTPAGADPPPPHCSDPTKPLCTGCFVNDDRPWLAPCDDNATASTGAQVLSFSLEQIPRKWLTAGRQAAGGTGAQISCDIFDIFATAKQGKDLGRIKGKWSATVPPHGVRFLRLSNCS